MTLTEGWVVPIHILFEISHFLNKISILFSLLSLSFIAKGLEMCLLGNEITTQIVLFSTIINTSFEHFLCSNRPN